MYLINKNYIIFLILLAVCFGIYSNTLQNDFIIDDIDLIVNNSYIKNIKFLPLLFITDFFHFSPYGKSSYYRPLTMLTFSLDYHLWNLNPFGYHLTNIILHATVALLFYIFIYNLFSDRQIALFSALIFTMHPIYANLIAYLPCRGDILAVLFILITVITFLKFLHNENIALLSLSLISYSCALLSRENAILFPFLLLLLMCISSKKKALIVKYDLLFIIVTCFYLLLRIEANISFPHFLKISFPLKLWLINFVHMIKEYLVIFFIPTQLRIIRIIPFVKNASFLDIVPFVMFIASMALLIKKRFAFRRQLLFLLLWFALAIMPLAKLMFYYSRQGLAMFEHWFYLPSLALCALLGYIFSRIYSIRKSISIMIFTSVCIFYTYNVFDTNSRWENNQFFFDYLMPLEPSCNMIKFNRAKILAKNKKFDEAIEEFGKILRSEPNAWDVYFELGNMYFLNREFNKALENYQRAIEINPNSDLAYLNIGVTQIYMEEYGNAFNNIMKALEINPNMWLAYFYLGNMLQKDNQYNETILAYHKVIELNPDFIDTYINLGIAYGNNNEIKEAIKEWKKALNLDPKNSSAKNLIEKASKLK